MGDGESLFDELLRDPKLRTILQKPVKSVANKESTRQDRIKTPVLVEIEGDETITAFTSSVFKKNAQSVITLAGKTKAEAGFAILSDGERLIYTPVAEGVGGADTQEQALYRGHAGGRVSLEDLLELPIKWLEDEKINLNGFKTIAVLHTHPSQNAFSLTDLESYDNMLSGYKRSTRASMRPDLFFGIFSCQYPGKDYRGIPNGVRLFMLQGPASSTEYQASQVRGFEVQKDILERSGMKVTDIILPINNATVDFSPLDAHFGSSKTM